MYGTLVGAGAVHAVEGMRVIYNTWIVPRRRKQAYSGETAKNASLATNGARARNSPAGRIALALIGVAAPVLLGLYAVSSEPAHTFASMVGRYQSALGQSFVFCM